VTVTIRVPRLLSIGLVFSGIIVAATLGSPFTARVTNAGDAVTTATTTYTRGVSCHGYDFVPLDNAAMTAAGYDGVARTGWGFYGCHLDLPHRSTVTRVRFSLYDNSSTATIDYCSLWRSPLAVSAAHQPEAMADVAATGYAETPGNVRRSDTTIQNATIDNLGYVYRLQCEIADPDTQKHTGMYGADVTYTISAANG
jgi:hypothetical protein